MVNNFNIQHTLNKINYHYNIEILRRNIYKVKEL